MPGGARRAALDRAAALLPADGILMTTDADSTVDPDWIVANLAELADADAVAGVVTFDEATRASLPPLPLRALEWRLADLHARLASLIDPRPHDLWPNHIWAWGASLAVTLDAYRRIGGLPPVPIAEDRALAAAVEEYDLRLRHSHAPVVYTSARTRGRAPGGVRRPAAELCRRRHRAVRCGARTDRGAGPAARMAVDAARFVRCTRRPWLRGVLARDRGGGSGPRAHPPRPRRAGERGRAGRTAGQAARTRSTSRR